ncbi:hypothetical protein H1R82_07160 [Thermoactinomyces intermedius]|jgi:hypothetical protein|uniref:Antitoxin VbhA domain-containing protein n=2 Tax=Thermoactinomyces TaxID=2023 RepID=A0A8I1A7B7_THEIN|nr:MULTISPECIES: hypothetical protein [Thermoactinomyces]MBA4547720.1 hypothetical protein [Thermoactinomyces intermedius]MBA4552598.1 hypothetical protein [Thermoactinomyces vulgaris]MBA4836406.1 hypothetical protein [Thermoactinomyces intermedius]MBH8589744.1 hypothetical protein [Thermoactinomyces vulgaris]MBH8594051.1 hypothetical protein [Thermoactinomyces intermedius]
MGINEAYERYVMGEIDEEEYLDMVYGGQINLTRNEKIFRQSKVEEVVER